MDAIGMMVTGITDGLMRVTEIGGLDHRILPGQPVVVHGREDLPGVIVQPPSFLLPDSAGDGPVEMKYLLVDVGLRPDAVAEKVRVGDLVSYDQKPLELSGGALSGHTLDNRVSVAATTLCLEALQNRLHDWDVWAVASVQEEETLGGALTSPFDIRPDIAIVIDVCFAKGQGSSDWRSLPFGGGVGLGYGPNIHPALYKAFEKTAKAFEIPYHKDLMPSMSGTDAMGVQIVAEGIPCAVLGIPLRYMHTPVETVSLKDIRRAGRLMAEFIADLKPETLDEIRWEE
jgi:endoglucanase